MLAYRLGPRGMNEAAAEEVARAASPDGATEGRSFSNTEISNLLNPSSIVPVGNWGREGCFVSICSFHPWMRHTLQPTQ